VARALAAAIAVALLAVSGAGGSGMQTPKRGGAVVFGPVAESACLNPLRAGCGVGPQFSWTIAKVLLPAFALAPDSTWRPALVSHVEYTTKPPFTLTYHIRPEARWNDGVPVTARDFDFTFRAIVATLPAEVLKDDPYGLVESTRVVNAKTFSVVLRERTAYWRGGLFHLVLPRHALAGQDLQKIWVNGIDNPRTGRPIGSGPFLVGGLDRGKRLTLVRNPDYWGPHPAYLDRLIIRYCQANCTAPTPAEVLESFRTGAVDMVYERDAVNVPQLRRIPGAKVLLLRTDGWEHLTFRLGAGGHPALRGSRNKLVRQAIAYGIDRAEIVRRLWGAMDPRYPVLHSALFLNTNRHYAPNWNRYGYRPALARSLLERGGCRPGDDGIYSCGGVRLSIRFSTSFNTSVRVRGIELMQDQLRRVGIGIVPTYVAPSEFFGQPDGIIARGRFEAASYAFVFITDASAKGGFGCGAEGGSGYCQRLVTADLDQADRIFDDAQRARVLNRADRQMAKDVPLIPLYQIPYVYAYKNVLRNVVPSPQSLFWNAEDWWLDD
jgi:peptide/nickel transport system substrate-binding protein